MRARDLRGAHRLLDDRVALWNRRPLGGALARGRGLGPPNQLDYWADSARLLMPFSIRRSMAKSPNSISTKLKTAKRGVCHL